MQLDKSTFGQNLLGNNKWVKSGHRCVIQDYTLFNQTMWFTTHLFCEFISIIVQIKLQRHAAHLLQCMNSSISYVFQ